MALATEAQIIGGDAMKYFLSWSDEKYSDTYHDEFDTKEQLLEFVNKRANNFEARFEVIYGRRIELQPVEVVKAYVIKD